MDFDGYQVDEAFYDELLRQDGAPRTHCRPLHDALSRVSGSELPRRSSA